MTERHVTYCRICEAMCGLVVDVDHGTIVDIHPDKEHVVTAGFACPKGLKQHRLYDSPDRLTTPLARDGSGWRRTSWDRALGAIGAQLSSLRASHGPDSIALYLGTAGGFSMLHPIFAQGLFTGLGSKSTYAPATQDCSNKFAAARMIYGFPFLQPFPDIDHTECLVIVGANPAVSKWSFGHVPASIKRLQQIEERGGKVFVIDPRRTETARAVGSHLFIRPGTDVYFYLSFLNQIFAEGFVERSRAKRFMDGLDSVEELASKWPPERTAPITGVTGDALREVVVTFGRAKGAALYSSTGVNMGGQGTPAFWLQEVINAVTGNLDRRGGTLVGRPPVNVLPFAVKAGAMMRDDRSRIGGFPSVNDCFPGGVLADEILTPGRGQVKALICTGGNPLLTMANGDRLRRAFSELELLVVIDIFRNETAELAHYMLPATSPFERPDLLFLFPTLFGLQPNPYVQATDRIVEPPGEARDETSIFIDLAEASGVDVGLFGSAMLQRALRLGRRTPKLQDHLLSAITAALGLGSYRRLIRKHPHGKPRPEHRGDDFLGKRVLTSNGRVQLAPRQLLDAVGELDAAGAGQLKLMGDGDHRFLLITKRAVRTHNSWTHNIEAFVQGPARRSNYLYVHTRDATRLGLAEGDCVDVRSQTSTVRIPIKLLDELVPGVVALPHGWGHQIAPGLGVASKTEGVNVNLLAADGPGALEPLSGMARLTAIEVELSPAAGPRDTTSWSGISESS